MKHLLVHLDGSPRSTERLRIADELARRFGAHLSALFATRSPLADLGLGYPLSGGAVEAMLELGVRWREEAKTMLRDSGMSAEWHELQAFDAMLPDFAEQALYADLMVIGQHDADDPEQRTPGDFVSSVVVNSGRPALLVPYVGRHKQIGHRVLVAWKATPHSARALSAALPLLREAEHVRVVEWGETARADGMLSIERYLKLNGIEASVERSGDDDEVGERLLSRAADVDADLLVMGCYGHSRAREIVLGGASRTVLRSMTLPVLMCH